MEQHKNPKALDRYLSPVDVWAMAFGCMVGWGAFVMPGTTFLPVAGPAGTVLAMAIGALIVLVIGWNFAYLMVRSPRTGGVYSYTKEAFGRDHAFLSSWFLCLSYLTIVFLNASALFVMIRTLLTDKLQIGYHYTIAGNQIYLGELAVCAFALAAVGLLYVAAKPALQRLHTIFSVILFLGVLITSICCLPRVLTSGAVSSFGTQNLNPAYAVFSLVILAPWAFVGFEVTAFDTAHFHFSARKNRRIIVASILMAGAVYLAMALVSVAAIPDGYTSWQAYFADLDHLSGVASVPTFQSARAVMGSVGLVTVTLAALAAILTGIIGGYRATTRVLSTMAEDRILSEKFSKTTYSILFVMVLSILISLLGRNTLIWFVDLTALGAIIGFGYTSAAAYKIAKMEGNRGVMVTGMLGTVISIGFVIVQLVPRLTALEAMGSEAFLLLSLWCLLGFVFYWRTITQSALTEYSGMSTSGVVLFSLLMYSALMWLAKLLRSRESVQEVRSTLVWGGIVLIVIVFIGLVVMLYIQNLVREKHEAIEREKIRAVEGSLAKSQFLFNMSHDIRTPMNAIIGYTNLAMEEQSPQVLHEYLQKISTSSQHLLSLINDILEMSRIESGRIELDFAPADLCLLFEDIYDLFSEQMKEKNIDFSIYTTQIRNRYVWCDSKNLNRVLLNVLSNAYKFTPSGGTVSASIWEIGNGENGYGSYEIRIQDSGIGMSREFVEKMFDAFERERTSTDSGVEGTGLGLAITKSIVDLMGGTIEVLTSPGGGTELIVCIKFRLAAEEDLPKRKVAAEPVIQTKEVDFTKKRLLLVEDNVINMEIANMMLVQRGFMVETAENGKVALDMVVGSQPGYYDAILMDIQMPVMDGYAATRAIRALEDPELANIPILAVTANAFKEDARAAEEAGMQAHVAKPIDVDDLIKVLTEVLGQQRSGGAR